MYKVLLADDESIIRRGLYYIVNWESLGFKIVGETSDGPETLSFILREQPDVVLIDIKMPSMDGLEVIRQARLHHYRGFFIILSGYSDFEYAQNAIHNNVSFYLIKPINENELEKSLLSISNKLSRQQQNQISYNQYVQHAKESILENILTGNFDEEFDLKDLRLEYDSFQVVLYDKYNPEQQLNWPFSDLLNVGNHSKNIFDSILLDDYEVILLKGNFAIQRFKHLLTHLYAEPRPQNGSPLNSIFLTYGSVVHKIKEICLSYQEAKRLMARRFFCSEGEHALSYTSLPAIGRDCKLEYDTLSEWTAPIIQYIQANQRTQLAEHLKNFNDYLFEIDNSSKEIRLLLVDMLLQIKEQILLLYSPLVIPFPNNIQIIQTIQTKYYLYEIILYFTEIFHQIMELLHPSHREKEIANIITYINKNYQNKLRLEDIATLFGYNCAYLGRLFYQETGMYFNTYLDQLRIAKSKELLRHSNLKISDIASSVGYSNMNYFQTRFRKTENMSPSEYRRHSDTE